MKALKIVYYITTGLISVMMLMSAGMYFMKYADVSANFKALGFPVFIIYPLAIAKIAAIIVIWTNFSNTLREWAYAGLFFVFALAAASHISLGDGSAPPAFVAIGLLLISSLTGKKIFKKDRY